MILTWNPQKYRWNENEYLDFVERTAQREGVIMDWSTGGRIGGVSSGDRVFMLRQGTQGRGIVASGTVVSEIYQDLDWDGSGGLASYVDVLLERLVAVEDALPTDLLKRQLSETNWDRLQMSGTFIRGKQVGELEELWSNHLASIAQNDTGPSFGQAMLMDAARRKKIENAAQNLLMEYYRDEGWTVTDTRYGNPFDAVAQKGADLLYLEAKGTRSDGRKVSVTRSEVDYARANSGLCMMGIWAGIEFDSNDEVDPLSGWFNIIPFDPNDDDLIPLSYEWSPPDQRGL
ncbi:MAG TPA: DUF3883 domain-containing protein [Edaphobacter sp.]|nr:DUF3883 domain-containing protein [Edaphobacter sp.]